MSYQGIELEVTLTIEGPFLCTATGTSQWGIDATFTRDFNDEVVIMASHIKGKLRESWRELQSVESSGFCLDLDHLLGKENSDGYFEPERGSLQISRFKLSGDEPQKRAYHRIRVESESGTADEGALLTFETPFGSGETTEWTGTISFTAETAEIENLINQIKQGLRWITALGANKGIGFGRLHKVEVKEISRKNIGKPIIGNSAKNRTALGLVISPVEPLLIGGIKRKSNYLESETNISGAVQKGALAACINRKLGRPANSPLPPDLSELPYLSKYFSTLCFQTAFPTLDDETKKRPTFVPLSTVEVKKNDFFDVALTSVPKLIHGEPPAFKLDWKPPANVYSEFGFACPKKKGYTRTAVEKESRRAAEENLFTYVYLCPVDEKTGRKIDWVSNVTLPKTISESDRNGVLNELAFVVENWWDKLGKRDSRVKVQAVDMIESFQAENNPIEDGKVIISLQSDTLMLNPDKDLVDLEALYSEFWSKISGGGLQLDSFFAEQKLLGGYLSYRFKKRADEPYYPFFLTTAGSVFVLNVTSRKTDKEMTSKLNTWRQTGLEVPEWALKKHGTHAGQLDWRTCPFTPENGFGEIKVNLQWHWGKQAK